MKILIGYDGSAASGHALHDLDRAGLPGGTQVLVVTAATPFHLSVRGHQKENGPESDSLRLIDGAAKNALDLADKAARAVAKHHPDWEIKAEALVGLPASSLLEKADDWQPDLIVLGPQGRTLLGRLAVGSVCERVLHHARTDVRVARPGKGGGKKPVRILVGLDGSYSADRALSALAARKWPKGSLVRIVSVADWMNLPKALLKSEAGPVYENTRASAKTWLGEKVEAARALLSGSGLMVSRDILLGEPRQVLLKECKKWKADCLFVGSRGLHAVDRFLIGSVSSYLAAHAPCTVEVVRKGP